VLRPDSGVDDADDHTLAGVPLPAELSPDGLRADERGRLVGVGMLERVGVDADDARKGAERRERARRQLNGEATDHHVVLVQYAEAGDRGPRGARERGVARAEVRAVGLHGPRARVEPTSRPGRGAARPGEAADAAAVPCDRFLVELHGHGDEVGGRGGRGARRAGRGRVVGDGAGRDQREEQGDREEEPGIGGHAKCLSWIDAVRRRYWEARPTVNSERGFGAR
jgi:hypothetical protein